MIDVQVVSMPEMKIGQMDFLAIKIGDHLTRSVLENFRAGGRPDVWPPLKATGEQSHLLKTGRLFASIGYEYGWEGPDWYVKVRPTGVPYAGKHNFGYAPQNIPQRQYLLFQREDLRFIREKVTDHIRKQLTGKP